MNKKRCMILVSALILTALIVFIIYNFAKQEEVQQHMVDMEKFWYANFLRFEFRMMVRGEAFSTPNVVRQYIIPASPYFDPFYDELVFVHNEAEAQGFPDNVIVAWPRDNMTEGLAVGINWTLENPVLHNGIPAHNHATLEEVGLTYPVTAADLVDNWDKVNALWRTFGAAEQDFIIASAPHGGPRTPEETTNE
jgi:hypothetical protein